MSAKELQRQHVIKTCIDGLMTAEQAAERLRLSKRRIYQMIKEYSVLGPSACIHGNARRPSPRKTPECLRQRVLEIRAMSPYSEANFTHFRELLDMHFDIKLTYSTLFRILREEGFKSPKSRRKRKELHPSRERKPAEGLMLQADATPFAWFGGKTRYALHGFIDDATGKITGLYLCKNECLLGYLEVLRQTLVNFGIPQSLYPDRYSVFFVNPKKEHDLSIDEQLAGCEKKLTQFGRIIERLGVDMFPAHSPQAKGRVEKLWDTLQSRLPVEFLINAITTLEEANKFLETYIARFNEQFAVAPKEHLSAFVPVPSAFDLDRLLSVEIPRTLSTGSTISISGITYFIEQNKFHAKTPVTVLISEKYGMRALINGAFYPIRPFDSRFTESYGQTPQVIIDLIQRYLFANAKAA